MKNYYLITLTLTLTLICGSLNAEEVHFIPRLETGFSHYSLSFEGTFPLPTGISNQSNEFVSTTFISRLGMTVSYDNLYFDISNADTESMSDTQLVPELNLAEKWTGERQELNVSLGYRFFKTGSLFIGRRVGEINANGVTLSTLKYRSIGIFAGINYGIPISDTGLLGFNLAYASLDTDFKESIFGFDIPTASGDGEGLKYGISYQGFLTQDISYTLVFDRYRYKNLVRNDFGVDSKMIEKESMIRIGLSYIL